jgi:hypothetical protein
MIESFLLFLSPHRRPVKPHTFLSDYSARFSHKIPEVLEKKYALAKLAVSG